MRVLGIAVAVLTLSLATAGESFAARAEMSLVGAKYPFDFSSVLWVTAAPGERNEIVFELTVDGIRVTDSSAMTPGGFCDPSTGGSVICRPDPDYPVKTVRVDAGDLDDSGPRPFRHRLHVPLGRQR